MSRSLGGGKLHSVDEGPRRHLHSVDPSPLRQVLSLLLVGLAELGRPVSGGGLEPEGVEEGSESGVDLVDGLAGRGLVLELGASFSSPPGTLQVVSGGGIEEEELEGVDV